jgi:hypothetical protein
MPSWMRSPSGEALALVAAGVRDDEAQVRVDHALLGLEVAALDALGELDLLARRVLDERRRRPLVVERRAVLGDRRSVAVVARSRSSSS